MAVDVDEINRWLWDLFLRREALAYLEQPMFALASLCRNLDEFELVMHSVEKLVALSEAQFGKQVNIMSKYIKDNILDERPLAIVATAWGEKPDSSQHLVQRLKLPFRNIHNVEFFNSVNAYERKDFMERYPRFVLVDEFCGTGNTIINRINHINNNAKSKGVSLDNFVCILFGMEMAYLRLKGDGVGVHFCTQFKAGISGYFNGVEREEKLSLMKRMEEELAPEVCGVPLPSLGHGEAEALFFVKDMNAPNSNFPILWWPKDAQGNDRDTITHRAEL